MISFCLLSNFKLPFHTKNEPREKIISKIIDNKFNFDVISSCAGELKRQRFCAEAIEKKALRTD